MYTFLSLFVLSSRAWASVKPVDCDPTQLQSCLDEFHSSFLACNGKNDCECNLVHNSGASCFESCPNEARVEFVATFANGQCANFNSSTPTGSSNTTRISPSVSPHPESDDSAMTITRTQGWKAHIKKLLGRQKSVEAEKEKRDLKLHHALASRSEAANEEVSPSISTSTLSNDTSNTTSQATSTLTHRPTTTSTALSPEEYHSRIQKQRYKENLRRIRSIQARSSSMGAQAVAQPTTAEYETLEAEETREVISNVADSRVKAQKESQKEKSSGTRPTVTYAVLVPVIIGAFFLFGY